MNKKFLKYLSPLFLLTAGSVQASDTSASPAQSTEPALPNPITATIDARQMSAPVSQYEYGMFIEHIGSLVYNSLWSEMVDDRKFFFPIVAKNGEKPKEAPSPFRQLQRKWVPIGSDEVISKDKLNPFVGEESPCVALSTSQPHGMRESGMTLVKGNDYEGRVYLRATPGTEVTVSLVWGPASTDRQEMTIQPTETYTKFPLKFTAGADSSDASLEISAIGNGTLHVGAVSLMPADNIEGFRPDVIALLKDLHSGIWRLPGGNVISAWNWYDSIGDIDRRTPYFDPVWNALQSNDVGMDEFMTLCKLIDVEPYISVSAGFGDSHSAAEEVEYINGDAATHMGSIRAQNGHIEPYNVKFWDIGNEPYGTWQFGRTDLKYYVYKHNDFAKAMRKADPSITLLASGSMPDRLWADPDKPVPYDSSKETIGDDWDWTGGLFAHCMDNFDGMTEHWYAPAGMKYDPEHAPKDVDLMFAGYAPMEYTTLEWIRYPSNRVRIKAEQWDQYRKLFPGIDAQKKFLSIDEYAFLAMSNNLKTALAQGMIFNEMLRYTDFLRMSAFTMGISTLDITPTKAAYNANGLVFKLYRDELGEIPVAVKGNSPQPAPKFPISGDQPRVNAGSPTYPLDMVATLTADRKFLVLSVVNAMDSEQSFDLNLVGAKATGKPTLKRLTGASLESSNHVGKPAEVVVQSAGISGNSSHLNVAPYSISIYRIPVEMEK